MEELDLTRKFSLGDQRDMEIKAILSTVYQALQEKGYNPINQIVGYILSEDPTYITNHNNARALIRRVDRDELLQTLVKYYLTHSSAKGLFQTNSGPPVPAGRFSVSLNSFSYSPPPQGAGNTGLWSSRKHKMNLEVLF